MKNITKILAIIIAAMCAVSCFAGCEKVVEPAEAAQGSVTTENPGNGQPNDKNDDGSAAEPSDENEGTDNASSHKSIVPIESTQKENTSAPGTSEPGN